MAFFRAPTDRPTKVEILRRISAKEWTDNETRDHLLQDLLRFGREVKPEEYVSLVAHPDPAVRACGERFLKERLDVKSAEPVFKMLADKDPRIQSAVFHSIVRVNPDAGIAHLGRLVTAAPAATAVRAMIALSSLPASRVGIQFVRFLNHEKRDIRHMALLKVADSESLFSDPRLQKTIASMADDEDERIRLKVLEVLAKILPNEAIRTCLQRLKDPSVPVQQTAMRVLASALDHIEHTAEAEDRLITLLIDGSESVRNGILDILMKRPERERMLRNLLVVCKYLTGWMRARTIASLRLHADKLGEVVVRLMEDEDDDVRVMALTLASTFATPEMVLPIVGRLKDKDWMIRMLAAETLGRIRDARAVPALIQSIPDPDIGCQCIDALSSIGDPSAVVPIARQLVNPRPEVRLAAIDGLRGFREPRVLNFLSQVRERDPDPRVRQKAADLHCLLESGKERSGTLSSAGASGASLENLAPLEQLLVQAREAGASDLHVLVDSPPTIRIHGKLQTLPGDLYTPETSERVILSILSSDQQTSLQQRGQIDFCHKLADGGRYRSSVYRERKGLAGSFRVIPREVPTFAEVGLPSHLGDLVNQQQGLIVIAGPTGSGKSTTLSAFINLVNEQRRSHILLLEDPIEFLHPAKGCLVNQRAIGRHTQSYAAALRGALREDPDVIAVGEMRDPETVRLAIEASETGHLVIGTMNTTSAPKTIDRLIESFPPAEQPQIRIMLSETIRAVICQCLIPNAVENGRVACFEILMGTLGVRNLIRENKTYQLVGQMQIGEQHGHMTLDASLARLVEARKISPEQAWLRAQNKENFEAQVSSDFLAGQSIT